MANNSGSPAAVDAELQAEALRRFNPLVFTFSVQTANNVCLPRIVEAMANDPAFAKGFYILDRKNSNSSVQAPRGKHGDRRSKQVDNTRGLAAQFYEDYVRIAVERELKRREEERAREAEFAALLSLYVEEGLPEAEAAEAARKELEEAAVEGTSSEDGDTRERLYVCLPTYPTSIEEVTDAFNVGLPFHAVVSLSSNVPLSGCAAAEKALLPLDSAKGKDKKEVKKPPSKDRNVAVEEKNIMTLVGELQQHLKEAKSPLPYLKSICIHSYDVPTEIVPSVSTNTRASAVALNTVGSGGGDASSSVSYRLKGTEGSVFSAIVDNIILLEERYVGFCKWKEKRVKADVPSYAPLRYPQTAEPTPLVVEEKGRKKSVGNKRKNVPSPPTAPSPNTEPIPVFDANPKHMSAVVAHRSVYDTIMSHAKECYFNQNTFRTACLLQLTATLSMTNPELLDPFPTVAKRERQQMLKDKEESRDYVKYIFDVAMNGVQNAHKKFLLSNEEGSVPADIGTFSTNNGPLGNNTISPIPRPPPKATGQENVLPLKIDENSDNTSTNIKRIAGSLMAQSFGVDVEESKKMVADVISLGVIHSGWWEDIAHVLEMSLSSSWKRACMNVGGCCELEVLYRGDGSSRTEGSVYAFSGPATFADYVNWQKYCANEGLYYNPPPPDSEEEEPSEEEEEEEEEDEEEEEGEEKEKSDEEQKKRDNDETAGGEDEDEGKTVKKKKKLARGKKVEEPPQVDVVRLADAALRRRRVYEDILKRLRQEEETVQELTMPETGAHCIAEETQWMFTDDGCTIEVSRVVGNTPQMYCGVSDPIDLMFGFLTMEGPPTEDIPLVISSTVRCFLNIHHVVQFFFEVVADNMSAVEEAAYAKALEAAKIEAKAQHDALEQTKLPKGSKEKISIPTLASLEELLISRIPVPKEREKKSPITSTRALFRNGITVTFDPTQRSLYFTVVQHLLHYTSVDLVVDVVCIGENLRSIRIYHIESIMVYADGCVVIQSPEIEGYRISFDGCGNYVTINEEGTMLYVTASGKRFIAKPGVPIVSLEPLMVSTRVDIHTGTQMLSRQDGVQIVVGSKGKSERATTYGSGCSCVSLDGGCYVWRFTGFPDIKVNPSAGWLGFTVDCVETVMNVGKQTLQVIHHRSSGEAILDWTTHRLHVQPIPKGNQFTMDCAFGGLIATSEASDYCVSPFGRCGEVREDVFKETEVASQVFLQRYEETGGKFEEEALQKNFQSICFPCGKDPKLLTNDQSLNLTTTTFSSYMRYAERDIDKLVPCNVQQSKDLLRGVVRMNDTSEGKYGVLLFLNPWVFKLLLQRLKSDINPTYSRLLSGVSLLGGDVQEHVVFLQSSLHEVVDKEREDNSIIPMATSVAQLMHISQLPGTNRAPRENKVGAIHFVSTRNETSLMTDDVADLLRHDRLTACEEEVWLKAMHTLPLVEKAEVVVKNFYKDKMQQCPQPLRTYTVVSGSDTTCAASSQRKLHPAKNSNYNFWRSTGLLVAADRKEGTLNESSYNNDNNESNSNNSAAARISASEVDNEISAATTSAVGHSLAPKGRVKENLVPFMHTITKREMPPQEHHFIPSLSVTPLTLSFGFILQGKRYTLPVALTNTSTVPCRYRVTFPTEYKTILCLHYPRHFLAAGLTVMVHVEVSGMQPLGSMSIPLTVTHEGGFAMVTVNFETIEEGEDSSHTLYNSTAVLLGPSLINSFVPGTTRRAPPHVLQGEQSARDSTGGSGGAAAPADAVNTM